jgi:hypothetical protein
MAQYFIYRHIRVDNGETFYVGCGTKRNNKRLAERRTKFPRAFEIDKRNDLWKEVYNVTDFNVEILFETTCKKTAYLKEAEYIKYYGRTIDNSGILTNISKAQGGCEKKVRITQMDIEGNTIKIWEQLKDIQSETDFLKTNIVKVCRKKQLSAYGFLWKYTDDRSFDNVYPSTSRGRYKGEKCSINKSGIILTNTVTGEEKMFRRQKDIAELFGINRYYINESVYGRYNIDGYTLRYREPRTARIRQI